MINFNIQELLDYNPETGVFIWMPRSIQVDRKEINKSWNTKYARKQAGSAYKKGNTNYLYITIYDKHYYAHRLAFLYMIGEWPEKNIDHVDGDGLNNKWNNLRLADPRENGANRGPQANNTSGFKGVSFDKSRNLYRAVITVEGKTKHLGRFAIPEEAHAAYAIAAKKYFGEFARVS